MVTDAQTAVMRVSTLREAWVAGLLLGVSTSLACILFRVMPPGCPNVRNPRYSKGALLACRSEPGHFLGDTAIDSHNLSLLSFWHKAVALIQVPECLQLHLYSQSGQKLEGPCLVV